MATTVTYYRQLKNARDTIAAALGVDVRSVQTETRAMSNAVLACLAILIKALTDNGVLTDAQLQAAVQTALAEAWDPEPPPQSNGT